MGVTCVLFEIGECVKSLVVEIEDVVKVGGGIIVFEILFA